MKKDNEIIKEFYDKIVNSENFDGDYFRAMIQATSMLRSFRFMEHVLKQERKKENEKFNHINCKSIKH